MTIYICVCSLKQKVFYEQINKKAYDSSGFWGFRTGEVNKIMNGRLGFEEELVLFSVQVLLQGAE